VYVESRQGQTPEAENEDFKSGSSDMWVRCGHATTRRWTWQLFLFDHLHGKVLGILPV